MATSDQNNNISYIHEGPSRGGGGGNGGNTEILQRLTAVETRLEGLATKADLERHTANIYKAILGAVLAFIMLAFTLAKVL